ncbi:MAG TPA: hypothetical protein V6D09_03300 [Leptolyngbyaceae cyanobacterium]
MNVCPDKRATYILTPIFFGGGFISSNAIALTSELNPSLPNYSKIR